MMPDMPRGARTTVLSVRCRECDEPVVAAGVRFCGRCGARVAEREPQQTHAVSRVPPEPRVVAQPEPRIDARPAQGPDADLERPTWLQRRGIWPLVVTVVLIVAAVSTVTVVERRSRSPEVVPALGGPGRANAFPGPAVREPHRAWQRQVSERHTGDWLPLPTLSGDRAYLSTEGGLHAVDRTTGKVLWRTTAVGYPSAPPVVAGGLVVVADHAALAGVDPASGDVRWRDTVGGGGLGGVAVADGDTVVVTQWGRSPTGGLSAVTFDARTGQRGASFPLDAGPEAGTLPVVEAGVIVVAAETGWGSGRVIHAYDLHSGDLRWRNEVVGEVVADDGLVIAVGGGPPPGRLLPGRSSWRNLNAYDVATGELVWSRPVAALLDVTSAVGGGRVYVTEARELTALDATTGATLWTAGDVERVLAADATIVVARTGAVTVAFGADDGRQRWEVDLAAGNAIIETGDVVLESPEGATAVDAESGEVRWTFPGHHGACSLAAFGRDVIATTSGTVERMSPGGDGVWRTTRGQHSVDTALVTTVFEQFIVAAWTHWSNRGPRTGVEALDPRTGEVVWRYETESAESIGQPVVVDGTEVVVPLLQRDSGELAVVSLDAEAGRERWRQVLDQGAGMSLSYDLDAGLGVRLTSQGAVEAFDVRSGRSRWEHRPSAPVWSPPVISEDRVVLRTASGISALDLATGDRAWDLGAGTRGEGPTLAVADGIVVAADRESLVVVDLETGEVERSVELTSPLRGGLALADGVAHVATLRGIETVDVVEGRRLTSVPTDRLVVAPPLVSDGRLAVCLEGGTIAVYD